MTDDELKQLPTVDRIRLFEEEQQALLEKYNIQLADVYHVFPIYNILPDEVKLALAVIKKNGVQYKLSYSERKKV